MVAQPLLTGPGATPEHASVTPEPRWLRFLALGSAAAVLAFGATGLALAVAGAYRPLVVFPIGACLWAALVIVARPILRAPGATRPAAHAAGAAGVVFVVAVGVWNALNADQHVLINRDGGVYANAGRWIAAHGTLRVVAKVGPFAHAPGLTFGSVGIYQDRHGVLSFQFAHLLPALLAEMRQLGGDRLMFATPAVLASVGFLALFLAAWRFVQNPLVALAAIVSFAFLLPVVSFSRDTVSEIPSQVLLFTALWLVVDRHAFRRPRTMFVVGLFLGLLQAARIDALLLLVGLPVLFAVVWIASAPEHRRSIAVSAAACAAGIAPGFALGVIDITLRSTQYLDNLRGNVHNLIGGAVLSVILAFVAVLTARRFRAQGSRVRRVIDPWVAPVIIVIGVLIWWVRPHVDHVRVAANPVVSTHQAAAGLAVDPTRAYWERSLTWMSWYLGPLSVAAAIVAVALLARAVLRGRALGAFAAVALLGPASALYLWHASAFPDQVWVNRRYLDSALPLLTLLAFGLVATLVWWTPSRIPRAVPFTAAVVLAVVAVVYPIRTVVPVRDATEQRGYLGVVDDACRIIGPRAAVVILRGKVDRIDPAGPQMLRGWCGAQVAVMKSHAPDGATLKQLADGWARRGTALWVAADEAGTIQATVPDAAIVSTRVANDPHLLQSTLVVRPSTYSSEHFSIALARVPND